MSAVRKVEAPARHRSRRCARTSRPSSASSPTSKARARAANKARAHRAPAGTRPSSARAALHAIARARAARGRARTARARVVGDELVAVRGGELEHLRELAPRLLDLAPLLQERAEQEPALEGVGPVGARVGVARELAQELAGAGRAAQAVEVGEVHAVERDEALVAGSPRRCSFDSVSDGVGARRDRRAAGSRRRGCGARRRSRSAGPRTRARSTARAEVLDRRVEVAQVDVHEARAASRARSPPRGRPGRRAPRPRSSARSAAVDVARRRARRGRSRGARAARRSAPIASSCSTARDRAGEVARCATPISDLARERAARGASASVAGERERLLERARTRRRRGSPRRARAPRRRAPRLLLERAHRVDAPERAAPRRRRQIGRGAHARRRRRRARRARAASSAGGRWSWSARSSARQMSRIAGSSWLSAHLVERRPREERRRRGRDRRPGRGAGRCARRARRRPRRRPRGTPPRPRRAARGATSGGIASRTISPCIGDAKLDLRGAVEPQEIAGRAAPRSRGRRCESSAAGAPRGPRSAPDRRGSPPPGARRGRSGRAAAPGSAMSVRSVRGTAVAPSSRAFTAPLTTLMRAGVGELLDELLEEERVAAGALAAEGEQLGRQEASRRCAPT